MPSCVDLESNLTFTSTMHNVYKKIEMIHAFRELVVEKRIIETYQVHVRKNGWLHEFAIVDLKAKTTKYPIRRMLKILFFCNTNIIISDLKPVHCSQAAPRPQKKIQRCSKAPAAVNIERSGKII